MLLIRRSRHFWPKLTYFFLLTCLLLTQSRADDLTSVVARMPTYVTHERDSYLCMRVELPEEETFSLVGFEPLADQSQVHHMLLFGCRDKPSNTVDDVWPCRMAPSCEGMDGVLYGWGRNAPSVTMPKGSGFTVGKKSSTKTMVLQIHFLELRKKDDVSGLKILLSRLPVDNAAGMMAFAASFHIPPRVQSHLVENSCCVSNIFPSKTFASRVHTHALGRRVTLDIHSPGTTHASDTRVVDLDPLQPQGFYTTNETITLRYGDVLKATCDFNSESQSQVVKAGHTADDEMCNVYLMWTSAITGFSMCVNGHVYMKDGSGVGDNVIPVIEDQVWKPGTDFGQITGIFYSQFMQNSVWMFSRKNAVWAAKTFLSDNTFRNADDVVKGDTISLVDLQTGRTKESFGASEFLLPHMISESPGGHLWVTDVGSHQVHKISDGKISMSLGQRNRPGSSDEQFCKPTEAIETRNGRLFVADGYCNDRVVEYEASTGKFIRSYDIPLEGSLPHSIVYDECKSVLFVALRLSQEVIKLNLDDGDFALTSWSLSSFGQPFAVRLGMYGIPYVLTWDLKKSSHLVELSPSNGKISQFWELPGIRAPHDFVFVPSPASQKDPVERNISIIVTETTLTGDSRAVKYLFQAGKKQSEQKSQPSQNKKDDLKDSFSHMNTNEMVKLGSDDDDDDDDTRQPQRKAEKQDEKKKEEKMGNDDKIQVGEVSATRIKSDYSNHVFIFALSLSMIVLWGFLQTLGTSQRLVRTRL